METRTDARHHIENLLAGVAFAVSTRDRHLLAKLTRGVRLRLGDEASDAEPGPDEIWAWLGESAGRTGIIQTISTIGTYPSGDSVHYLATFQNWEVGPEPACTSIGTYSGCLVSGPQVWKWTEHTIIRARNPQTRTQKSIDLVRPGTQPQFMKGWPGMRSASAWPQMDPRLPIDS